MAFLRNNSYKCYLFFNFENLICYEYGKIPGKKISDKTWDLAVRAATLDGYMGAVVSCCKEADSYIWSWLLEGVTEGVGYEVLRARGLPCGKDYYYERYRKFFWLLDKVR